jgi:hypothetical protein
MPLRLTNGVVTGVSPPVIKALNMSKMYNQSQTLIRDVEDKFFNRHELQWYSIRTTHIISSRGKQYLLLSAVRQQLL